METSDVPKFVRGLLQNPALLTPLLVNTARYAIHPVERRLPGGWSLPPRSISIMITDRCNLRCRMCHYATSESVEFSLNRAGFMSLELFEHILDTCPGKPVIALTGGEPLLHPQVVDFIQVLKKRGFSCSLTTNGSFLQSRARELCESGLDLLVVSIDGSEETHDQIRSQGTFRRAISGIQEIMSMPHHPLVTISTVIMDINHKELHQSFSLAEASGVDILHFNHLWMHTDQMRLNLLVQKDQQDQPDMPESGRVLWKVNAQDIDPDRVFNSLQSMKKKETPLPGPRIPGAKPRADSGLLPPPRAARQSAHLALRLADDENLPGRRGGHLPGIPCWECEGPAPGKDLEQPEIPPVPPLLRQKGDLPDLQPLLPGFFEGVKGRGAEDR